MQGDTASEFHGRDLMDSSHASGCFHRRYNLSSLPNISMEHQKDLEHHEDMSELQKHAKFFDRNGDGLIYPCETYQGMKALGFNSLISISAAIFINGAFSYSTLDSWIPSLLFPLHVKNIRKCKHGSDTGIYNSDGRFVPEQFEAMYNRFAVSQENAMTQSELIEMTKRNRDAYDFFGWIIAKLEWSLAYSLVKDERGLAPKESIKALYDGSIFYHLEQLRLK